MYLKSSERFDQKIDIVVNMEKNNQALMEQMRITAQLVDEMINLKILTLDAQTAQASLDAKAVASASSQEVDEETNVQTEVVSDGAESNTKA